MIKKKYKIKFELNSSLSLMFSFLKQLDAKGNLFTNSQIEVHIDFLNKPINENLLHNSNCNIVWSNFQSSLGNFFSSFLNEKLISFSICKENIAQNSLKELKRNWHPISIKENPKKVNTLWFDAISKKKVINAIALGTIFQTTIWKELLAINAGQTKSYFDIANDLNTPRSVRAVGTAIGQNPLFFFIPCHRIIRKSGHLGGYRWGLDLKKELLRQEYSIDKS